MEKDANKLKAVAAIWGNPERVFGCPFNDTADGKGFKTSRPGGNIKTPGAFRLKRTDNNIIVFGNTGSGVAGIAGTNGRQGVDVFTYLENYVLKTRGFGETLAELSKIYGFSLEYSPAEQSKIKRQQLAAELCQTFITALGENLKGATAQYLNARGLVPDGVHFGELTTATIKRAVDGLKNRGFSFTDEDLKQLGATPQRADDGYNLVIPYYHNGKIVGIKYRDITGRHQGGDKYLNNTGFAVVGYCDRLTVGEPAIICEGEIDAIRLITAGQKNVISMGGPTINANVGELLRRNNIEQITYIPDIEFTPAGERITDTIAAVIRAAQSIRDAAAEPLINGIYIGEIPTPDNILSDKYAVFKGDELKKYKIDVDTYGKENGADSLAPVVKYVTSWWDWELSVLMEWAKREDQERGIIQFAKIESRFREIYNRCNSPFERQRIRKAIRGNKFYQAFGITPEALDDIDTDRKNKNYRDNVKNQAAKLQQAVEGEDLNPDRIAAIVADLNTAQGTNAREEWDKQLAESWDDELEAIKTQPDALTTKWELGNIDKDGKFCHYENIEFTPADITVFCAATSHGKTSVLFQSAIDLVKRNDGKIYLYVSCEENKRQLTERALNCYIDIPTTENGKYTDGNGATRYGFFKGTRKRTIKAIIKGSNPPAEYWCDLTDGDHYGNLSADVRAWLDRYRDNVRPRLKLIHTDNTAQAIAANIKYYVAKYENDGYQVGGVFVDYMQLLTSDKQTFSRTDELKDVCKVLRMVAADIEQPVIIAAQLNREAIKNGIDGVTVANIGEGADIERIAHDVYFIWQNDKTINDQYFKWDKPRKANGSKNTEADEIYMWNYTAAGERSNRIYKKAAKVTPFTRELKADFLYFEQLKARDGRTGGWGLFPFDGERGTVGENDKLAMKL